MTWLSDKMIARQVSALRENASLDKLLKIGCDSKASIPILYLISQCFEYNNWSKLYRIMNDAFNFIFHINRQGKQRMVYLI